MNTKFSKRLDEMEITEKQNDKKYHENTEDDNEKKGIIYKRLINIFDEDEKNDITEKQIKRENNTYEILEKRLNELHSKNNYESNKQPLCEEYEKKHNLNANVFVNKIILSNKNIINDLNIEINKGQTFKEGIISGNINVNKLAKYGIYNSDILSNKINSSINDFKQILANIILNNTDDFEKIKFDNVIIMPKLKGILKFKANFKIMKNSINTIKNWYNRVFIAQTINDIKNKYDENSPEVILSNYIEKLLIEKNINKSNYFEFLYKLLKDNIKLENNELTQNSKLEANNLFHSLLTYIEINKNNPKNEPIGKEWKNINQIRTQNELENLISKFGYILDKHSDYITGDMKLVVDKYKIKEFYDLLNNFYEVYCINQSTNDEDVFALRVLAHGPTAYKDGKFDGENAQGRWCVRKEYHARDYLSKGNFYVVYKNGKVFAGLGIQAANCVNRINERLNIHEWSILMKPFLEINSELVNYVLIDSFSEINKLKNYVIETGNSGELFLNNLIEKSKKLSGEEYVNFYEKYNLRIKEKDKDFFDCIKNDENICEFDITPGDYISKILKSNESDSKLYVVNNEDIIYEYFMYIFRWNKECLLKQNIKIEKNNYNLEYIAFYTLANSQDPKKVFYIFTFAKNIYGENYDEYLEEIGIKDIARKTISQHSDYAYNYANSVIYGRWEQDEIGKQAEIIIAKSDLCISYANHILEDRWPQDCEAGRIAEQNILKNSDPYILLRYNTIAFKNNRWPQNENIEIDGKSYDLRKLVEFKIAQNELLSGVYAEEHIRGRWPQNEYIEIDGKEYNIGKIAEQSLLRKKTEDYLPESFFNYLVNSIRERCPIDLERDEIEELISREKNLIIPYLDNCLMGKWPKDSNFRDKAESTLGKNLETIFRYCDYIGDRWPQDSKIAKNVEYYISKNCDSACLYAANYIGGRWPYDIEIVDNGETINIGKLAEYNIANGGVLACEYAVNCIRGRWPQNIEMIYDGKTINIGKLAEYNIVNNYSGTYYIVRYTSLCLIDENGEKGARWPIDSDLREIAEKKIAQNLCSAYDYAKYCIKGRWPQDTEAGKIAEQNLSKNKAFWDDYKKIISNKEKISSNWYKKIKVAQTPGLGYGQIGHYDIDSPGYYGGTMGSGQGHNHSSDNQMPSTSSEDPIGKEERLWEWRQVNQEFKEHWGVDKVKAWPNDDIHKVRICLVCKEPLSPKHIKKCNCEGCPFKKFKNKSIEWLKANPPEKLMGDIETQGRYLNKIGDPYDEKNRYWAHNRNIDDMAGVPSASTSKSPSYESGYDAIYKWNDKKNDDIMYPSMLGGTASSWYNKVILSRSSVPLVNIYDDKRKRVDIGVDDLTTNRSKFGEDIYNEQGPIGEKREPPDNKKDEPEYFQEKDGEGITEKLLNNNGSKGSDKNMYDEISKINPGSRGITVKEINDIIPKKHKIKRRKNRVKIAQVNIDEMWGNLMGDVRVEGIENFKHDEIQKEVYEDKDIEDVKTRAETNIKKSDIVSFIHEIYSAVVVQSNNKNRQGDKVGGGFFINENMIVTCNHVVFDNNVNTKIWIFKDEKPYKASLVISDSNLDIAVLQFEDNFEHKIIKFDIDNEIKQRDPIVTIGTPLGYQGVVTFGTVTLEKVENKDYSFIDCDISPGNSGGPVINVKNQKCVGMAVSILKDIEKIGSGLNLILGIKTIIEFLNKNNIKYFV